MNAASFGGAQDLMRLMEGSEIAEIHKLEEPVCSLRGVKIYLPEPTEKGFENFKKLVDLMCRFRYNFLMIEIGGAMEYKSHPEINEGWIEYSNFMNEYSGKPQKIQKSFDWNKNSIHTTNGGGRFLTQKQIGGLLDYCRERHIEVVPELPSLSHCDFLLTRHPELSERLDDPYPDTACPNHPDYYPLLFDLIDEILTVFKPTRINLGHDEYYTVGLCPRCKGKSVPQIYADDIKRCYDFLKSRNVKMMIWSEKLLNAHFLDGYPIGGGEVGVWHQLENPNKTPPTWPAIDMIPNDIEMMHWYWSVDRHLEEEYIKRDMPMLFGNMRSDAFPDWENRSKAENFKGTCCSNWGATDSITLQRNGILYEIAYASRLHWGSILESFENPKIRNWVLSELFAANVAQSEPGRYIELVHSTTEKRKFTSFFDGCFVDEEKDLLGYHVFSSDSGKTCRFPVIYGSNIASQSISMELGSLEVEDMGMGSEDHPYDCHKVDRRLAEASFSTLPEMRADGLSCRCRYKLPNDNECYFHSGFEASNNFTGSVKLIEWEVINL